MKAVVVIAASAVSLSLTTNGVASADDAPGPLVVTTTFGLGAGRMPDVASDPSTNRAYVTSQGDDSLYVVDATG